MVGDALFTVLHSANQPRSNFRLMAQLVRSTTNSADHRHRFFNCFLLLFLFNQLHWRRKVHKQKVAQASHGKHTWKRHQTTQLDFSALSLYVCYTIIQMSCERTTTAAGQENSLTNVYTFVWDLLLPLGRHPSSIGNYE